MSTVTIVQLSPGQIRDMIEESVKKAASALPKRRTNPYTRREVRDLFQVSYPTIYRWEAAGLIERIEKGGRVYYTPESVEEQYKNR